VDGAAIDFPISGARHSDAARRVWLSCAASECRAPAVLVRSRSFSAMHTFESVHSATGRSARKSPPEAAPQRRLLQPPEIFADVNAMNSWRSFAVWLAFTCAWLTSATPAWAASCPVCGTSTMKTVYRFTRLGYDQKVLICGDCARLETICSNCAIPVKKNYTRLAGGRLLCDEDAKTAVMTQDAADRIFDDTKREVQSILSRFGSLPHRNINFILESKPRLDKTGAGLISQHDDRSLLGLTRTRVTSDGGAEQFNHTIYALHGLTRERFMVVVAHEYGHTWIHENVKRKLTPDAHEGFCDWIAWQVISKKAAPHETKVLLESDYSRGQLQAFMAAEKSYSFYHVINWMKNGMDPEIDKDDLSRLIALRGAKAETGAPTPAFSGIPAAPRPAPTSLVLKGLSGTATRRFALINDATFMANEHGKVRLSESNVLVHCVQIGKDFVVVQVAGEAEPRTLKLNSQ